MRVYVLFAACLAVVGCTRANGDYQGGGAGGLGGNNGGGGIPGGGGSGGSGGGIGGNGVADMATAIGPDLATPIGPDMAHGPAVCTADARRCVTSPVIESQSCSAVGQWTPDRECPYGTSRKTDSGCMSGYCEVPPPMLGGHLDGCVGTPGNGQPQEFLCDQSGKGFSCQPFINPVSKTPTWWCAVAVEAGSGGPGDTCNSGADCYTGFCASNGMCFWGCQTDDDCQQDAMGPPNKLTCKQVTIHVEGQTLSTSSCSP